MSILSTSAGRVYPPTHLAFFLFTSDVTSVEATPVFPPELSTIESDLATPPPIQLDLSHGQQPTPAIDPRDQWDQTLFLHRRVFLTVETPTHAYICQDPSSKYLERGDILKIISQASECDLTTSGNAAYMRLELSFGACHKREDTTRSPETLSLEEEVGRLQSRLQTPIEYVLAADELCFSPAYLCVFNREINETNSLLHL